MSITSEEKIGISKGLKLLFAIAILIVILLVVTLDPAPLYPIYILIFFGWGVLGILCLQCVKKEILKYYQKKYQGVDERTYEIKTHDFLYGGLWGIAIFFVLFYIYVFNYRTYLEYELIIPGIFGFIGGIVGGALGEKFGGVRGGKIAGILLGIVEGFFERVFIKHHFWYKTNYRGEKLAPIGEIVLILLTAILICYSITLIQRGKKLSCEEKKAIAIDGKDHLIEGGKGALFIILAIHYVYQVLHIIAGIIIDTVMILLGGWLSI